MKNKLYDEVIAIMEKAGNSDDKNKKPIIDFHGGTENLKKCALVWAEHHGIFGVCELDIVVAYCTAVEFGYRIAKLPAPEK